MNKQILTIEEIMDIVKPLAEKYHISEVYIFGSYARGEADGESDVDAFEIHEVNIESDFYKSVMRDRVRIA